MPALDFPWALIAKDPNRLIDVPDHKIMLNTCHEDLSHTHSETHLREALEDVARRQMAVGARARLLAILGEAPAAPQSVPEETREGPVCGQDGPVYHLLATVKSIAIQDGKLVVLDKSRLCPAFCLVNVACVNGQTTLIEQPLPREAYSPSFNPARYYNDPGEVAYDADAVFDSSDLDEPLTVQGSIVPLAQVFRPESIQDSAVDVERALSDSTVPFSSSLDQNLGSDSASSRRTSKTSCCSSQCESPAEFVMNNFGPSRLLRRERSSSLSRKKVIAPAIAPRVAFYDGHIVSTKSSFTTESV